jgi:very-short-patch-repair endonuclease
VAGGLPEPEVQCAVITAQGIRHADLGYRDARLLIEYQGDDHRISRKRWLEDLTRRQLFEDAGYRVIELGADDLVNELALVERIRRALQGRSFSA